MSGATPVYELAEALCDLYGGRSMTEREHRVRDAAGIVLRLEKAGWVLVYDPQHLDAAPSQTEDDLYGL